MPSSSPACRNAYSICSKHASQPVSGRSVDGHIHRHSAPRLTTARSLDILSMAIVKMAGASGHNQFSVGFANDDEGSGQTHSIPGTLSDPGSFCWSLGTFGSERSRSSADSSRSLRMLLLSSSFLPILILCLMSYCLTCKAGRGGL